MARWFNIGGPCNPADNSEELVQDGKAIHVICC